TYFCARYPFYYYYF
nr:immunoglobulin heavy chain junction region [Mus musculus]